MKYLANLITSIRILASILLLFQVPFSTLFFVLYLACGISDATDGFVARKLGICSSFGASLDSIADIIFIGISLYILLPLFHWPLFIICWIIMIVIIRFISLGIGFIKYHTLSSLHTYLNKACGLLLFFFPIFFLVFHFTLTACFLCTLSTFASLEELIITIRSDTLTKDIPGLFL